MDEPLLARFGARDLPADDLSDTRSDGPPLCLAIGSLAQEFQRMARDIVEACPRSADRTLALRALLEARRHAIDSLLYAETPR